MDREQYLKDAGLTANESEVSPAVQKLVDERNKRKDDQGKDVPEGVSPMVKEYLKNKQNN